MDRDQLEAIIDEAHKLGLRTTTHIAVEETTASDYVELGVNSIEHFYGVADAALDGIQDFPPDMNYSNEIHRFGRAGELYAQADPEKLRKMLDVMVEKDVAWNPTFSIYEASRDLIRAQNLPWFKDYLHPSLEEYFKPSSTRHGSFFIGWTATQEASWKQALPDLDGRGARVRTKGGPSPPATMPATSIRCTASASRASWSCTRRPASIRSRCIEHATWNGAKLLGMEDRLGKVREGFIADLLVVNGNPLENLRLLNPYGTDVMPLNGQTSTTTRPRGPNDRTCRSSTAAASSGRSRTASRTTCRR